MESRFVKEACHLVNDIFARAEQGNLSYYTLGLALWNWGGILAAKKWGEWMDGWMGSTFNEKGLRRALRDKEGASGIHPSDGLIVQSDRGLLVSFSTFASYSETDR